MYIQLYFSHVGVEILERVMFLFIACCCSKFKFSSEEEVQETIHINWMNMVIN